jgi:hypothetical protein
MADLQYNLINTSPAGYQDFKQEDLNIATEVTLPGVFDLEKNFIEVGIYSVDRKLLQTVTNYAGARQLGDAVSAGKEGSEALYIDPIKDAQLYGYGNGGVILTYYFFNNLFLDTFYIREISTDRTEIKATPSTPTYNFVSEFQEVQNKLLNQAYFDEIRLNFGNNQYVIGVNIDLAEDGDLLIKLYEPLPSSLGIKVTFSILEEVSNPIAYEIETTFTPSITPVNYLKGPNFNLEVGEESSISTEYLDYSTLLSYPVTSSYHQLFTTLSGSGVELNIDYTDYRNFVHFSSAYERLANFKYKLDLVHLYEARRAATGSLSNAAPAIVASNAYYDSLITGVLSKFDGYEKYLYFESSSYSWPKSTSTRPYLNHLSSNPTAISWFAAQTTSASLYDELNESRLVYTIPEFIRQDTSNTPYSLFVDMVAQHFDNLWVYAKAVTGKYNADNRINYGVSKDLIEDTLRNFGVKLYSSNFSAANLASLLLGEFYDSGSEQINTFVTASNLPTPDRDILTETYKRIYHNLPYLIKTKGTERGLRALINCFGIPSGSLEINVFGGVNSFSTSPYFGSALPTGSKIRLDNTGSLVAGDTLSYYTSIQKEDKKYTQDVNLVEVGFSPAYNINNFIEGTVTGSFDIDQYIGDPRYLNESNYNSLNNTNLYSVAETLLSGSSTYNVFDFVRLIKFFDNQLFKMVRDFVPARDVTTSGIIIKPHVLNRSKIKSPSVEWSRPEYSASIDTAFVTASDGGAVDSYSTAYTASIPGLLGTVTQIQNTEVEKYNGELGGTVLDLYTENLNGDNPFFENDPPALTYQLTQYLSLSTPGAGFDEISEQDFFTTLPLSTGNMYFFWDYSSKGGYNYLKYIWFRNTSLNGINISSAVREFTTIVVNGTTYTGFQKNILGGNNTLLTLSDPGTGFAFNPATYPTTATTVSITLLPYVPYRYYNSDYNALLNNATVISNAANVQKLDYSDNPYMPINIAAIRNNTADKAEVQEYIYNSTGMVRGKYIGKQLNGALLNIYSEGDITYGKEPVVEDKAVYFSYFNQLTENTPVLPGTLTADIRYLIDQQANLLDIQLESSEYYDLIQSFPGGSVSKVALNSNLFNNINVAIANGARTVAQSGVRPVPIVYSHTGSEGRNYTSTLKFGEDASITDFTGRHNLTTSQSPTYAADDTGYAIIFNNTAFQSAGGTFNTGTGEYTFSVAPTFGVNFTVTFNVDSLDGKTWFDVSEDIEPIVEYFSGSNWYQLKHSIVSLGGTSRLPDASNPYTVRIDTESSDNIIKVKAAPNFRTGGPVNFKIGDKVRARIFCKEGDLEIKAGSAFEITQTISPAVNITPGLLGYWYSAGAPAFGIENGTSYLLANSGFSTALSNAYGQTQTHAAENYPSCSLPFTVEVGDQIRFANNEVYTHNVVEVITPDSVGSLPKIGGGVATFSGSLVIKLDPPILNTLTGSRDHLSSFLIRRNVEDANSIVLRGTVPGGYTGPGVLVPEYITPATEAALKKVLPSLKSGNN